MTERIASADVVADLTKSMSPAPTPPSKKTQEKQKQFAPAKTPKNPAPTPPAVLPKASPRAIKMKVLYEKDK